MQDKMSPSLSRAPSGLGAWLHVWGPTLWAAAVTMAGIYFLMLSREIGYSPRPGRLGPAFWPQVILVMLTITAAIDCFVESRKVGARARALASGLASDDAPKRVWWLMALGLAITLAYVNLSNVLGFPLANFLFMFTFMMVGGFTRLVTTFLVSALGTLSLVLLFVKIVYISMPLGTSPFKEMTIAFYNLLGVM